MRPAKGVPTPAKQASRRSRRSTRPSTLIEALASDWDPSRYKDRYQKRLKRVIKRKEKGETIKAPEREDDALARRRT